MTLQETILVAVVAAVGIPSAWRNPTAAALVLAWIASKMVYLLTGNGLAVDFYLLPDIAVLGVIFAKPEYRPCAGYRSGWHQLACLLMQRSPADRAVMLCFPAIWASYLVTEPYLQWHLLWSLSVLQFLFASAESLEAFFLSSRDADAAQRLPDRGDLLVAYRGSRGHA